MNNSNVGRYTTSSGDKTRISSISVKEALQDIEKVQCLYIRNIKDDNVLFLSPTRCRLMEKKAFDALLATSNVASINYTKLYKNYSDKIKINFYYNNDTPYINLIRLFYDDALNVSVVSIYDRKITANSTYEQYSNIMIKNTGKNLLQEFFINKPIPKPVLTGNSSWKSYDDVYFSKEEADYSDVEFGTLFSLNSFKLHKKGSTVTYTLKKELLPIEDGSGQQYYYKAKFGDYIRSAYTTDIIESTTHGLFNIISDDFENRFPEFVEKIKLNDKLFAKYTNLRETLMNRDNENKIFMFRIGYQNKYSLYLSDVYDFDLMKRTFDYSGEGDYSEDLINISKVIAGNNFVKVKSYGSGGVFLNKNAFTDPDAKIDISMGTDSYNDIILNFKNGRHKCSIEVTDDILNELEGAIPEEQLTMLKCEFVLRK